MMMVEGMVKGQLISFFGASSLSGTKSLGEGQSADLTILGKGATDVLGASVSAAGDVNGDGFDDIIVGAYKNNDGGGNNEGAAYIFFGANNLSGTKNLGGADSADVTMLGKGATDRLGYTVSGAGDINGDGFDDVIVGAPSNDDGGGNDEGAAYVIFGASNLSGTFDVGGGGQSPNITIFGKATDDFMGNSVSGSGDVNGDGFDDFIIGAYFNDDGQNNGGAAYIFFGASNLSGTKNLGGVDSADVTILGNDGYLGNSVSGAGDVNDDGFDDIMVGAYNSNDCAAGTNCGATYIFYGSSSLSGTKDVGSGPSADVTILGKAATDQLGRSISGLGDVNADGFPDIIIGAYTNDDAANNAGAAYIVFGASDLSGTKALGEGQSADVTISGKAASDNLGRSVGGGRSNPGP